VAASLTCRMCDSMTSSIRLVEALHSPRCNGGLHVRTAVV
jgi:hypothetical protein